jgi:hypothetical protein
MKRWIVYALPLAIALLTLGNPMQSWAENITDNNSNAADDMSLAAQNNLNNNDVAANNSAIIEDNLNGPIGNDTQVAKQAANDQSVVIDDIKVKDVGNTDTTEVKYNDTQVAKQAANDNSVVVDDIKVEDVGNTDTTEIKYNDTQVAKQAANDHSIVVDDVTDVGNDKSTNVKYNDTQVAEQAANDHSFVVGDIKDVGNTDNSINIKDIDVKVAASVLNGAVSGNYIAMENLSSGNELKIYTGDNCFASGDNFTSNGIFVNSQNTGLMSQTQQSIAVQANVYNAGVPSAQ